MNEKIRSLRASLENDAPTLGLVLSDDALAKILETTKEQLGEDCPEEKLREVALARALEVAGEMDNEAPSPC